MDISNPPVRRPEPNPNHLDIDLVGILDGCVKYIRGHVSMSEEQSDASALWVAHTHVIDAAEATPYLSIRSAEKQSGKTPKTVEQARRGVPVPSTIHTYYTSISPP